MTEEEATEAMQVAMTVGATRMQVMLNAEQAKLSAPLESPAPAAPDEQGVARPAESAAPAAPAPATFIAAEVVSQAGGG